MIRFMPDQRPSKWGATAAVAKRSTLDAVLEYLTEGRGHPFDGAVRLSDATEIKGYKYILLQVSLDFGHPAFPAAAHLLDEMGGSEFQLIAVETPEQDVYLIVDKNNLLEEEIKPDHPLLLELAAWLGSAMNRSR